MSDVFLTCNPRIGRVKNGREYLLGGGRGRLQGPHERAEDGAVEGHAREDEQGALPVVGVEQELGEGREDERAHAGSADGDARRERPLRREVVAHAHDGRQVDQAEAHPCKRNIKNTTLNYFAIKN